MCMLSIILSETLKMKFPVGILEFATPTWYIMLAGVSIFNAPLARLCLANQ
jgi:hypothetical protein